MSNAKFKALWPLPGGSTEYVNTLAKILEKIRKEKMFLKITSDELRKNPEKYCSFLRKAYFQGS